MKIGDRITVEHKGRRVTAEIVGLGSQEKWINLEMNSDGVIVWRGHYFDNEKVAEEKRSELRDYVCPPVKVTI
jgi:predicted lysophospholipase L1 biosynthesis ABC-type transport system permease subunit